MGMTVELVERPVIYWFRALRWQFLQTGGSTELQKSCMGTSVLITPVGCPCHVLYTGSSSVVCSTFPFRKLSFYDLF